MSKYAQVNVKFGADISSFSTAMQNAAREMKKAGDQLQNVGKSMTMNLTAPIVALGAAALYSFGQIDSLKRGLISFSGSAALAEEEFTKLREVAKLPGIGLQEAVSGSINLQAIGMSADKARIAMTAFGNAIATVGGGKESFDLAIRGFGQLMNASRPLQQDLYQIANQLPQINKLMIEAFGTNRAEDLAKMGISGKQLADFLVTKLGELPKVSGGIKNSFENMSDSIKISLASFGESIEKNFNISGKLDALSNALSGLVEGFKGLDPVVQKFILGAVAIVAVLGPLTFAIGGIITLFPTFLAGFAALSAYAAPIGITLLAVTAVIYALSKLGGSASEAEKAQKGLTDATNEANRNYQIEKTNLDNLFRIARDKNLSDATRLQAIKDINAISPEFLGNITKENINTLEAKKSLDMYLASFREKVKLQALEQKYQELMKKSIDAEMAIDAKKIEYKTNRGRGAAYQRVIDEFTGNTPEGLAADKKAIDEQIKALLDYANTAGMTLGLSSNIDQATTPPPNLTPESKEKKWEPSQSQKYNLEQLKEVNKRTIEEQESFRNDWDKGQSNLISTTLKNDSQFKSVLDTAAMNLDAALSRQIERWREHQQRLAQLTQSINDTLVRGVSDAMINLARVFGENLVDKDPFKDLGWVLLGSLGTLMEQIGVEMIIFGGFFKLFQESIKKMQPEVAIIAGLGMVAAGAAISKIASKGMQPSSASGGYSSSGGTSSDGGNLSLESRLDGRDIILSGNETTRVKRR